ncbi:MAG: hypothetical protein ACLTDI_13690 [Acutalibacteraceae bacterium]
MDVLFSDLSLDTIFLPSYIHGNVQSRGELIQMSSLEGKARAIVQVTTLCFIPPETGGDIQNALPGFPPLSSMFSAHFLASCLDRLVLWFSITS